jgi:hypothetical protein
MQMIEISSDTRKLIQACLMALGGKKTSRFASLHHSILYRIAEGKQKKLSEKNWKKLSSFVEFILSQYLEDLME